MEIDRKLRQYESLHVAVASKIQGRINFVVVEKEMYKVVANVVEIDENWGKAIIENTV